MITETTISAPDATLAVEVAAFLLVLAVVAKFVLPRLRATIEQRETGIADALAAAEAADRRRVAAEVDGRAILSAARREARLINDRARTTKESLIAEGRRSGQDEYNWRVSRFDRERQRHDDLIRQQFAIATTETLLNAIREMGQDDTVQARFTEVVESVMTASASDRPHHVSIGAAEAIAPSR